MQNLEFSVNDMDCKSCVDIVMKKLKSFEGIRDVKVDPHDPEGRRSMG